MGAVITVVAVFSKFSEVNENIQQMIYEHATLVDLRQKAFACGMRTLREDGKRKIAAGMTTIEEVLSATVVSGT